MKTIAMLRAEEPDRPTVPQPDSVEKIVKQLSLLTHRSHTYKSDYGSRVFDTPVREVRIDKSMYTQFICKDGCSACCLKFTIDYLPSEIAVMKDEWVDQFKGRSVFINGNHHLIYTSDQTENPICDFLTAQRPDGGLGCGHWPYPPLSCASAPQIQIRQLEPGITTILKGPFKSANKMFPTPQCEFISLPAAFLPKVEINDLKLLERFQVWANYLGIDTCIEYVQDALWDYEKVAWRAS